MFETQSNNSQIITNYDNINKEQKKKHGTSLIKI